MKIAILDTAYPQFLKTLPAVQDYASGLEHALSRFFGTHTGYSRYLQQLGWKTIDVIANHERLQQQWALQYDAGGDLKEIARQQILRFNPDVLFLQDLSYFSASELRQLGESCILAGQCSCRFEDDERLKCMSVLFSSFPFYVERFKNLGIDGRFLPLAFDPLVLERARIPEYRTYPVSFVGGYGRHWDMDRLFVKLAEETPIQFWGYGFEEAPEPVRKRWNGPAWGLEMYEIYLRSQIVLNRHGGISGQYANNLRMFEATGCGALLLTEEKGNLGDYFTDNEVQTYRGPEQAASKIRYFLEHDQEARHIASAGQQRTLATHTYAQRMPIVSEVLKAKMAVHA